MVIDKMSYAENLVKLKFKGLKESSMNYEESLIQIKKIANNLLETLILLLSVSLLNYELSRFLK
jgi:hypothetical protein